MSDELKSQYWKAAEDGNLEDIQDCIARGVDTNASDKV